VKSCSSNGLILFDKLDVDDGVDDDGTLDCAAASTGGAGSTGAAAEDDGLA